MRIRIAGIQRALSGEEIQVVHSHLQTAFSRFGDSVQSATVAVDDGIYAKECRLRLRLRSGQDIVVRSQSPDLALATRQAAQRAAAALDLHLGELLFDLTGRVSTAIPERWSRRRRGGLFDSEQV